MANATARGDELQLRYGDRTASISRELSYDDAQSNTRELFSIGDEVNVSFHRTWSNWAGTYDRIGSDSWDAVARVSTAVRVEARGPLDNPAATTRPTLTTRYAEEEEEEEEEEEAPTSPVLRQRRPSSPSRPISSNSGLYAFGNAAPGPSRPVVPPDSPAVQVVQSSSQPGQSQEHPPPPYSRHPTEEHARKVTFLVSTPIGDMVTLSAKRSVRVSKALEAACNIFKLRPAKCRLHHAGWIYGSVEMERLTLQSLDIEDGDRLGISWDDIIVRSELWMYPSQSTGKARQGADPGLSSPSARVTVKLAPHWSFDAVLPPAPIDASGTVLLAGNSTVTWNARLQPDGQLLITNAPRPVACLAWESQARPLVRSIDRPGLDRSNPGDGRLTEAQHQEPPTPPLAPAPASSPPPAPQHPAIAPLSEIASPSSPGPAEMTPPPPSRTFVALVMAAFQLSWTGTILCLVTAFGYIVSVLSRRSLRRGGVLSRRGIDRDLLEDEAPFEPMESTIFLNDGNSVLLQMDDAEQYLREVYMDMGVPNGIAQKWLSQRLTAIRRHRFVAVRFISKSGYAKNSVLRITPEPETVVRALLVYCGVPSDEIDLWPRARERGSLAYDGTWSVVVGVSGGGPRGGTQRVAGVNAVELSWVEVMQEDMA